MRRSVRAIVIKDNNVLVMKRNKFGNEFYALVGGAIDVGETNEAALHRELAEEASLTVANPRLVIEEDAGEIFGRQYIYLCDYVSGQPRLAPNSEEAHIHALGQNLYQPMWLPIDQLAAANLWPVELKRQLLDFLTNGFPQQPITLTINS